MGPAGLLLLHVVKKSPSPAADLVVCGIVGPCMVQTCLNWEDYVKALSGMEKVFSGEKCCLWRFLRFAKPGSEHSALKGVGWTVVDYYARVDVGFQGKQLLVLSKSWMFPWGKIMKERWNIPGISLPEISLNAELVAFYTTLKHIFILQSLFCPSDSLLLW